MRTIILLVFCCFIACSENSPNRVDFLLGKWKGKEQFEVWEKSEAEDMKRYSNSIIDVEKKTTNTLSNRKSGGKYIYEATAPDQNNGKTIPFTLNDEIKEYLSFENVEHDFPKKNHYKIIDDNTIEVNVLGNEGQGFSYIQSRIKSN
jgi:hypothetical protein